MKLNKIKKIHFTGIKGVGMTALALCAQDMGISITGTDIEEVFVTDQILKERNIVWEKGFKKREWVTRPDLLITTGSHGGLKNPEVVSATQQKIPVITQGEAVSFFAQGKKQITVCGVGGKTTISSMIASVLLSIGKNTSFVIGSGKIKPIGCPGKFSEASDYFVCEADEYAISPGVNNDPKFSLLDPYVAISSNLEHDHPDIYPTINETLKAYQGFLNKVEEGGVWIANIDNSNTKKLIGKIDKNKITYGKDKNADWKIINTETTKGRNSMVFEDRKGKRYKLSLKIPGEYNLFNALSAFIACKYLGLDEEKIIKALEEFAGVQRRFEKIGKAKEGFLVFDDYAHHPNEIESVLKSAGEWLPSKKIIAVFQPHTYSRTKALFNEFSKAFKDCDKVLLMDIYSSAREKKDPSVFSEVLVKKINENNQKAIYTGNHKNTVSWIKKNCGKGDMVITLGAGDVFYLHDMLL